MTVADQVLAYLRVLAWPVIVALALVAFRDPIKGILGGIEEFEGFGVKAKIRRQVTQAVGEARAALRQFPVSEVGHGGRTSPGTMIIIATNMRKALSVGINVVDRSAGELPLGDRLRRMTRAVDLLDSAIVAVLVGTVVVDSNQNSQGWFLPRPLNTPADVEIYMVDVTGYSGWRGVIETRDILRKTVASMCDKTGKTVSIDDANLFVQVATDAYSQLIQLVNSVVNSSALQ